MKVLLVNKYHYVRGGSETYYFGLAELLKSAGCDVIYFAMKDERNIPCDQSKYFINNVEFNGNLTAWQKIKAGLKMVYSFEAKKKIGELLDDEKPDIVHINLFHRVMTASIIDEIKKRNIPIVFTMHDLNCICPNHTMLNHGNICEKCLHGNYWSCVKEVCFKKSRVKCLMAAIESWFNKVHGIYNKIDLYVTPSEFYKRKLEESGITKSKIVCMRNFLPADSSFENKLHKNYYLYFGRLSYEKGVHTLLEAVKLVKEVHLEIAGTGPEETTFVKYVKDNGLEDRVHFNGFLKGSNLTNLVNEAKCVILPSEWYENGPYTIMEAMQAGKPVIVSDLGGLPEIVDNGKTGYIFSAFDVKTLVSAIMGIESLTSLEMTQFSIRATEKANKLFSMTNYKNLILGYYEELVGCNCRRKKPKIATVTWYTGNNYGSTMQSYALQTILKEKGYDCDILAYKPTKIKNWMLKIKNHSVKATIDYKINELYVKFKSNKSHISNMYLFDEFRNKYQTFTRPCSTKIDLKEISTEYDFFICGSDQIWSPFYFDQTYYLNFTSRKKRIAYAPSFGVNDLTKQRAKEIKELLEGFEEISVREEQGKKIIWKYCNRKARVVLDPTMLLPPKHWESLASDDYCGNDAYIVCYFLRSNSKYQKFIKNIASEKNLKIKLIPMVKGDYDLDYSIKEPIGPEQWLGLIKNARFVVTDSFHCTVFSIMFKKDFASFRAFSDANERSQNSRIDTLLKMCNFEDRIISDETTSISTIDEERFNFAHQIIHDKSIEDIEWLINIIEKHSRNQDETCLQ